MRWRRTGSLLGIALACTAMHCLERGPLSRPTVQRLIESFEAAPAGDFEAFLARASEQEQVVQALLARRAAGELASENDRISLYRLLAIHLRSSAKAAMIDDLATLVAIPSYRRDGIPPYQNPAIHAAGAAIETMARREGLEFHNRENRIFEVILRGAGAGEFGIYAHVDVVPALAETWGLPGGVALPPFQLTVHEGNLYGRGTEDNKSSIVAAIHAMGAVKRSGLPLERSVRLLIETTEETGGEGIHYYKERYNLPPYNIGLDSAYPVVTAEKGFGALRLRLPARPSTATNAAGEAPIFQTLRLQGAPAINQVPGQAFGEWRSLRGTIPAQLQSRIQAIADQIKQEEDWRLHLRFVGDRLLLNAYGVSAHGMEPEKGKNALPLLLEFAVQLHQAGLCGSDAWIDAARLGGDLFGRSIYGERLGLGLDDDFMGPYTIALTQIQALPDGRIELGANARLPRGRSAAETIAQAEQAVARYAGERRLRVEVDYQQVDPLYRNPEGPWIQALLDTFADATGREGKAIASAGATTARELPNGINFGPSFPDQKYMGHNDNEFKRLENLLFDAQMFAEMILRIGNLESME